MVFHGEAITALAASGGIATALAAVPVERALVRRLRVFNAARLQTLGELLAVRVREGALPAGPAGRGDDGGTS